MASSQGLLLIYFFFNHHLALRRNDGDWTGCSVFVHKMYTQVPAEVKGRSQTASVETGGGGSFRLGTQPSL